MDDPDRLQALVEYRVIDIPRSRAFNEVTGRLARHCQVPVAFLSVVGGARQWLFARVGLHQQDTPASEAFCLGPEAFDVVDMRADGRYRQHPMVVGPPGLRALACAPLITADGFWLGALCMADTQCRRFTAAETACLCNLSREAMALLEAQRDCQPLIRPAGHDSPIKVCAWCKRVNTVADRWVAPEHHWLGKNAYITHGICPDCLALEMAEDV